MPETHCIVPGCTNTGDHILPKAKDRREAWIQAIKRGKNKYEKWSPPSKYCYICREHFVNDDYISYTYHGTTPSRKTLKRTAVPSVFAWKTPKPENEERASRYASRTAKKRKLLDDITHCVERKENINPDIELIQTSTDLEDLSVGYCTEIQCENDSISTNDVSNFNNDEVGPVKFMSVPTQTLDQQGFTIEDFRNDPQGVHYYTGLEDISKFYFVLQTLGPAAYCLTYIYFQITSISVPDQFFMVLMKLRRHTPNFELSRNFKCSDIAVRNIIITWIKFMALQWQELDMWPSKELVQYFAPSGFKKLFPSTRVIIDGTECPVKKPKNPKAQQQTFSTYKNRNTTKILVGATPGGLVSFVSEAYGGSTSDRQITERSSLVNLVDPKDSIMADKGFNVQDLFAPRDVHINIPTFFKKKNRMTIATVVKDRKVSSKRVHIERVIGLAKTFKILVEPLSATEAKLSSDILNVCFMLCNFRLRIVSKYA